MPDVQCIADSSPLSCKRVEVVEACGEWFVHVVEDGRDHSQSFEDEAFALSFADSQRARLELQDIVRI